jgi:hypothetical protein
MSGHVLLAVVVLRLGKNTDLGVFSHIVLFDRVCTKGSVQSAMRIGIARPSSLALLDMIFLCLMSADSVLLLKVHQTTKSAKHAI